MCVILGSPISPLCPTLYSLLFVGIIILIVINIFIFCSQKDAVWTRRSYVARNTCNWSVIKIQRKGAGMYDLPLRGQQHPNAAYWMFFCHSKELCGQYFKISHRSDVRGFQCATVADKLSAEDCCSDSNRWEIIEACSSFLLRMESDTKSAFAPNVWYNCRLSQGLNGIPLMVKHFVRPNISLSRSHG
jgi:hypothetical protein